MIGISFRYPSEADRESGYCGSPSSGFTPRTRHRGGDPRFEGDYYKFILGAKQADSVRSVDPYNTCPLCVTSLGGQHIFLTFLSSVDRTTHGQHRNISKQWSSDKRKSNINQLGSTGLTRLCGLVEPAGKAPVRAPCPSTAVRLHSCRIKALCVRLMALYLTTALSPSIFCSTKLIQFPGTIWQRGT